MVRIAICTSDILAVNDLEHLLFNVAKTNGIDIDISLYQTIVDLKNKYRINNTYDILYVDLHMNEREELVSFQSIRKMDGNLRIVYLFTDESCKKETIETTQFDFIKKPIAGKYKKDNFLKIYEMLCGFNCYFGFQYKKEWIKVVTGEILYFESKGRDIFIYLKDGRTECFHGKLDCVEERMNTSNNKIRFLRIHQSYLVNFHAVRGFCKQYVRLIDDAILPVSKVRYKQIKLDYIGFFEEEIHV